MTSYSVGKLKANLSAALSQVVDGQEIIVTDHNKPIAKLVALQRLPQATSGNLINLLTEAPIPLNSDISSANLVRHIRDDE